MKRFVFTDLDNTIVRHQSRITTATTQVQIVGLDETGKPSTIMTTDDLEFFESLKAFGTIIPTTGRSIAGYQRLHGLSLTSWAILNHGATILQPRDSSDATAVDPAWLERTKSIMTPLLPNLLELYQSLLTLNEVIIGNQVYSNTVKLHQEHSLPLYVSVRATRSMPEHHLQHQRQQILELVSTQNAFEVLQTGRITSIIPQSLNKKLAVLELIQRLQKDDQIETLGVGDALTDLPFMQVCNWQRTPEHSEIHRLGGI